MKLPIYFVSDNHFFMDSPPGEKKRRELLFSLFKEIKRTQGSLIIGGDFFDFWFDYGDDEPHGYEDILDELHNLSSHGIEIHYVLGNHDYWDFGYFKRKFNAEIYTGDLQFSVNNQKILVTHGDGLLLGDSGYRFMRKVIRSKLCISLFKILGGEIGSRLAKKISKTSKQYNHSENHNKQNDVKKKEIRHEINTIMHNHYLKNYDVVLIGHYHLTGIDSIDNKKIIYLGDWLNYYTVTYLNDSGWKQLSWEEK